MNNKETRSCSRCSAPIPVAAADLLCPACLMSRALAPADDETVQVNPGTAPAIGESTDYPRVFGGYRLLGLLGQGGMAAVYEAEQIETGRRVALKMLSHQLDSADMRQRFLREGRLAASVNHPNSLYVFGAEEIDGLPVITMEIAGGGTLKDKLRKRGPLPVTEAVDAILDVISGLEAALADGVLHRDVKPSNCFIGPDGSVKVGDFGLSVSTLAKDDTYMTATGVIMGTPAYAAPEQLRGDDLDLRADIYSVGATLFTLLTGRAPFEGTNAVQVVAHVMNQKPIALGELREDLPAGLQRVVELCLAKEPNWRYDDYASLRDALLPFSSMEPEPASFKMRSAAGWVDFLIAFLVPYVVLMLTIGQENFHLRFIIERTLWSARYYFVFLGFGILYFTLAEGIWGAGLGKRLKGLRVVRSKGRSPGLGRALLRILTIVMTSEIIRIPLLMATISATSINDMTWPEVTIFIVATSLCPVMPVLLMLKARKENGFAAGWDSLSATRVVLKQSVARRPPIEIETRPEPIALASEWLGPFQVIEEKVPGEWIVASDAVLRRQAWLLRRRSSELPESRRNLARPGRPRWLQAVTKNDEVWDAFEADPGVPFSSLVADGKRLPWGTLRHLLHDLATEVWAATNDGTLPAELSLDQVWITDKGQAVLLDEPWPMSGVRSETIPVGDLAGQQRFLHAFADHVDSIRLPLHARSMLRNLEEEKFEKLSFLTGTLRGLLTRPTDVGKGIRAGAVFLLPLYVWVMTFVGVYAGEGTGLLYESTVWSLLGSSLLVLAAAALTQILALPFRWSFSHEIFRLTVIDARGKPASKTKLLIRWAITWLPLFIPLAIVGLLVRGLSSRLPGDDSMLLPVLLLQWAEAAGFVIAFVLIFLWIGVAVRTVFHPHQGLHDRLAGTWVVRR